MIRLLSPLLFFIWAVSARSAVMVEAVVEPEVVAPGQAALLTVKVQGGGGQPRLASVEGLDIALVSKSNSFSMSNGQVSSSRVYIYQIQPLREGTFALPAAEVDAGGGPVVRGPVLKLQVQAAAGGGNSGPGRGDNPPPAARERPPRAEQTPQTPAAQLRLELPKTEIFVGELLPLHLRLGVPEATPLRGIGMPQLNGEGFSFNPLPRQPSDGRATLAGQPQRVFTWPTAISPVKAGDLQLSAEVAIAVLVQERRGGGGFFDDDFFPGFAEPREFTVRSEPVAVKVLPLPAEGRPEGFGGAVGQFQLRAAVSAVEARVGEPITLWVQIAGEGNFDRVRLPEPQGPGWKVYAPTTKFEPEAPGSLRGAKVFEMALVAERPGTLYLPSLKFSSFDPKDRRYHVSEMAPLEVVVSGGESAARPDAPAAPPALERPGAAQEGPPLPPLRAEPGPAVRDPRPLYQRTGYWLSLGGLAAALALVGVARRAVLRRERSPWRQRLLARDSAVRRGWALARKAAEQGQAGLFFREAAVALRYGLVGAADLRPEALTHEELLALAPEDLRVELRQFLEMHDAVAFAGCAVDAAELRTQLQRMERILDRCGQG